MTKPQTAPKGWKLVPIKPTKDMIKVGENNYPNDQYGSSSVSYIYEEMVLAAPEPPND